MAAVVDIIYYVVISFRGLVMIRTIISLDKEDKDWLDAHSRERGVTMTSLVRQAVAMLRAKEESERPPLGVLLEDTTGIWKAGDGLDYQEGLRDEW
jgi:hypothetical protein